MRFQKSLFALPKSASIRSNRRVYLIALVIGIAVLVGLPLVIAGKYENLGRRLGSKTPEQIKQEGNALVGQEKWDEALFTYQTLVEQTAQSKAPSDRILQATAHNNMAYVYFYGRQDYSQAFQELLRSRELSTAAGDSAMLPYVDVNVANIYTIYADHPNAWAANTGALMRALRLSVDDIAITAMDNLLLQALSQDAANDAMPYIKAFEAHNFKTGTPMLAYTRHLINAVRSHAAGNVPGTITALEKAEGAIDAPLTPERYRHNIGLQRIRLLLKSGQAAAAMQAIQALKKAGVAPDLRAEALHVESEVHSAMGDEAGATTALLRSLKLQDSIYSQQGYGMIRDLRSDYEARRAAEQIHASESAKATAWRYAAVAGGIIVALTLLLLYILRLNRRLRRSNRELFLRARHNAEQQLASQQAKPTPSTPLTTEPEKRDATEEPKPDNELLQRIAEALRDETLIADPDFSLQKLAKTVGSNTKYVSQAINTAYYKNFPTLLGEARVAVACRRLADTAHYGNLSIEGICTDLGFRSRPNFNTVFKRVTGLTPSEYKKIALSEQGKNLTETEN